MIKKFLIILIIYILTYNYTYKTQTCFSHIKNIRFKSNFFNNWNWSIHNLLLSFMSFIEGFITHEPNYPFAELHVYNSTLVNYICILRKVIARRPKNSFLFNLCDPFSR